MTRASHGLGSSRPMISAWLPDAPGCDGRAFPLVPAHSVRSQQQLMLHTVRHPGVSPNSSMALSPSCKSTFPSSKVVINCPLCSSTHGRILWKDGTASTRISFPLRVTGSANISGHPSEDESQPAKSSDSNLRRKLEPTLKVVREFAGRNYLPLVLIGGVLAGLAHPEPGKVAQQYGLSAWTTSGIFFISGLNLRSREMQRAGEAWHIAVFALASILLITPLAAIPVLRLQLFPSEFATGLAVFFCVPTTLSSAVSLTQLAGANTALALALTVASNILGIVTMPILLSRLLATSSGVSIPAGPLMRSLTQTLLVPLLAGKITRKLLNLGAWVDSRKRQLSMLSSSFLALVPWMQVSCSKTLLLQIRPLNLLAALAVGTLVHLLYLVGNATVVQLIAPVAGATEEEVTAAQRAAVLVASQKTLPVAVAVIGRLGPTMGEAGVIVLPCIALHVIQITIDSMLVNYWMRNHDCKSRRVAS